MKTKQTLPGRNFNIKAERRSLRETFYEHIWENQHQRII